MERYERPPKRPIGWAKPYWARAGLYTCAMLMSFLISLLVVRFGCGVVLRAAISAEPMTWRMVDTALEMLICIGATWYFASQEGYAKRTTKIKTNIVGGFFFLLVQFPVAILFGGAPYAAGPLASALAQLFYFGNQPLFAASIEKPTTILVVGCMAAVDVLIMIPTMVIGECAGVVVHQREEDELTKKHKKE